MLKITDKIIKAVRSTKTGEQLLTDSRSRIVVLASWGFIFNLAYALYNGVLGAVTQSLWFISMCAYYILLSIMRFSAVLYERRKGSEKSIDTEIFVMRFSGVLLMGLAVVLSGLVYLSLTKEIASQYRQIVMITIATYTFIKITLAVINFVKVKKKKSPLLSTIRNIACADAAASVLSLQRSMLVSFGNMDSRQACFMNAITGAVICLTVFSLGAYMAAKKFN